MSRACPYLAEFIRTTTRAVLPGAMPPLNDLPPEVVAWWREYWGGTVAVGGLSGLDFEAQCWRSYCTDGELFIGRTSGDLLESISPDEVEIEATAATTRRPTRSRGRFAAEPSWPTASTIFQTAPILRTCAAARCWRTLYLQAGRALAFRLTAATVPSLWRAWSESFSPAALAVLAWSRRAGGLGTSGLDGGESATDAGTTAAKQFPPGSLPIFPAGNNTRTREIWDAAECRGPARRPCR